MGEGHASEVSEVVEQHTGRKFNGFMSGSHQEPDLIAGLFVLEPKTEPRPPPRRWRPDRRRAHAP